MVIDSHPLMPTGSAVRSAIGRLSQRLADAGVKVAHSSALLPNLADSARLYMRLLTAAKSTSMPPDRYEEAQRAAAALAPGDDGLEAERTRGTVMSHRDWLETDLARARIQQQWSLFFREFDVVLYPPASVPAFPHDHSLPIEARHLEIDGKEYPTTTRALCGPTLPVPAASQQPRRRSIVHRAVCRSGCNSSDPISRIAGRLLLLNFLKGSSTASHHLRAMPGN